MSKLYAGLNYLKKYSTPTGNLLINMWSATLCNSQQAKSETNDDTR